MKFINNLTYIKKISLSPSLFFPLPFPPLFFSKTILPILSLLSSFLSSHFEKEKEEVLHSVAIRSRTSRRISYSKEFFFVFFSGEKG